MHQMVEQQKIFLENEEDDNSKDKTTIVEIQTITEEKESFKPIMFNDIYDSPESKSRTAEFNVAEETKKL